MQASTPSRVLNEAAAEKAAPCSSVRKNETGPEMSGKPAITPPTKAPQRRAASRQSRISRGVRRILTSIGKPPGLLR